MYPANDAARFFHSFLRKFTSATIICKKKMGRREPQASNPRKSGEVQAQAIDSIIAGVYRLPLWSPTTLSRQNHTRRKNAKKLTLPSKSINARSHTFRRVIRTESTPSAQTNGRTVGSSRSDPPLQRKTTHSSIDSNRTKGRSRRRKSRNRARLR